MTGPRRGPGGDRPGVPPYDGRSEDHGPYDDEAIGGDYDAGEYDDGEYDDGAYDAGRDTAGYEEDEDYDLASPVIVDDPGPGRSARDASRSGFRRHPVLTGLLLLIVVLLVVVGGGLLWAHDQIDPGGKKGPLVSVVIPQGASTSQIGRRLAAAGVIHDSTLFAFYVRLHGGGPLLAGTYQLDRNSPYSTAIAALEAGPKILTENLTIPPGFTMGQIAARVAALPGMGLSAQKFLAAASAGTVRSPYEPAGVDNLEGLVFPDTYQVRQGESEADILYEMVGEFNDQAENLGLSAAAQHLGVTPYQLIETASIVEREAKLTGDRGNVASVIYNRIKVGMPLGADSTQTYYLRLSDPGADPTVDQLNSPSPYNTRINKGFPPTPIASPSLASLEAAADPPTTDYLYWVEINPDGQLGFASDDSGFERLQAECQAAGLC